MPLHRLSTGTNQHVLQGYTYATAALRLAATGFVAADVGKVALQQSDNSYWLLQSYSPIVWIPLSARLLVGNLDATSGLAIADSPFDLGVDLPLNAIITRAWYEVLTTFTSATDAATIALGVKSDDAAGILAAIAISGAGNPWDAGIHDTLCDGTAAAMTTKTTATRALEAVLAVEALTDGELNLFYEYVVSA